MNDKFTMWVGNNESKWSGLNIHDTTKCHILVGFHYLYPSHLHENLTHKKKLYQPQAAVETKIVTH